jgi:hypothetical protein
MKSLLASALLLVVSNAALADWTGPQVIQALYPRASAEDVLIQLPNYNPAHGCNHPNGRFLSLSNHPNFSSIYALLLAAHASEKPINIFLASGACTADNYSQVSMVISGTIN